MEVLFSIRLEFVQEQTGSFDFFLSKIRRH